MPKINLTDLSNLQNEASATAAINNNNTLIEAAIDNSISRDGTQPNQMNSDLDMNSNKIINLPDAVSDKEPVTYSQYLQGITSVNNGAVIDGSFVTLGSNPTLLNERVLTAGPTISIIDGGPGSNVVIGLSSQELTAIAGAGSETDKIPYYDGIGSVDLADLSPFARTLLDDIDATAARATLGVSTGSGDLVAANNLSDVANTTTARNNLGAGTGDGDMLGSNNLSDVASPAVARTNIGAGDLLAANNFSDVASVSTARTNLSALGVIKTQVFTSSGTYTPDTNMVYCIIECVGGGAGGGGNTGAATGVCGGGGGGGGSYARTFSSKATIGASKTVTIGAGGSAGGSTGSGGNGGDTSLGSLCIGKGGFGGTAGSSTGSIGVGGAGGVIGTGDLTCPGGAGGGALYASVNTVVSIPGDGGSSFFGGGARHPVIGFATTGAGVAATVYGAGGSGGGSQGTTSNAGGGAGKAGIVIITEFCSQ